MKVDRDWFEEKISTGPWKPRAGLKINRGKTPRQFAIVLFKSQTEKDDFAAAGYMSRILSGEHAISIDLAVRMAELLDVSVVDILRHLGFKLTDDGYVK